jgi:pilus assembly protein CpaC
MLSGAVLVIGGVLTIAGQSAQGQSSVPAFAPPQQATVSGARDLPLTVGKSLVVESPVNIQRISVGDSAKAEAMAVSPREVLVNAKAVGDTSLIIWQAGGSRQIFDLRIREGTAKLDAVRQELQKELPGQDVSLTYAPPDVFVRGTVKDMFSAERAVAIAGTLGKAVNLLRVNVPAAEMQILLKVRFANVDRAASQDLGLNVFSTGALNTIGSVTTGQYGSTAIAPNAGGKGGSFTLGDALNLFLFRSDINLGMTLRALQNKRLLEILAEPNLMAINGKQASFLAGGEFPVPMVQPGAGGGGIVTIQWREFGVRTTFVPTITPRGTIRLKVTPEVSSLDIANGINLNGFLVPALSTRRVQTEVELQDGQSFAIAGLLDNRVVENMSKIPGLSSLPVLGKLFQSRSITKNNTELLVVVTPEIVQPIPADMPVPIPHMPLPFVKGAPQTMPRTPPVGITGSAPPRSLQDTIRVEELEAMKEQTPSTPAMPAIQFIPILTPQGQGAAPAAAQPAPTPRP